MIRGSGEKFPQLESEVKCIDDVIRQDLTKTSISQHLNPKVYEKNVYEYSSNIKDEHSNHANHAMHQYP